MSTLLKLLNFFKPPDFPLRVKARANKLNSFKVDWRYRVSINIKLFFRFNIIANKEYCFITMGSLKI